MINHFSKTTNYSRVHILSAFTPSYLLFKSLSCKDQNISCAFLFSAQFYLNKQVCYSFHLVSAFAFLV